MIATPTRKKGNDQMAPTMTDPKSPRPSRSRLLATLLGAAFAAALLLAATAQAAPVGPVLDVRSNHFPTNFPPGERGGYQVLVENLGDADADDSVEPITVEVTLPEGLTATAAAGPFDGFVWGCSISPDGRAVSCEYDPFEILGGFFPNGSSIEAGRGACVHFGINCPIQVSVDVAADAGSGTASAEACRGGSGCASADEPIAVSPEPAGFGIMRLEWETRSLDGTPSTQAGAHPGAMSMRLLMNRAAKPGIDDPSRLIPRAIANPKTLRFRLPRGVVGDPTAAPKCSREEFAAQPDGRACPPASQVGVVSVHGDLSQLSESFPLYSMEPPPGVVAQFGMDSGRIATVFANVTVAPGGDYRVEVVTRNMSQLDPVFEVDVTLWGTPADPIHDPNRGVCTIEFGECPAGASPEPFLANPTDCTAGERPWSVAVDSWQEPGAFHADEVNAYPGGLTGCDRLFFEPELTVQPTNPQADSPSGYEIGLGFGHQDEALSPSHLKDLELRLPEGVSINPAAAHGLKACSPEQIGLESAAEPSCPDASRIGSVRIETPVLDHSVRGAMFLAEQENNPFGSLLAIYLVAEAPGVMIKLPGHVEADPETGRLRTTFSDNPQLPFSDLTVRLKGGPTAPLVNPSTCGEQTAAISLTPWARPGEPVVSTATFGITEGCGEGSFSPSFAAGTASPIAGANAPFLMRLGRKASEPEVRSVSLDLPEGLSAKLAGIPYCSEAALSAFGTEGITDPGTAASEIADPACPAESLIGEVLVGAGAGPSPFYLDTGRAYLAGPYRGAPLSVAIVTAAKAGPFDLGSILVRSALYVNERTAEITVRSDEIPAILEGIPLNLRDIRVNVDREGFSLNPTSCDPMEIGARIKSHSGPAASLSHPFQVTNCAALGFEPRFGMQVLNPGRRSTLRSFNPAMRFTVVPRPGDANLGPTQVVLPSSVILDQSNIRTICTRDQFAADACPSASVYGFARAWSPLLDEPLTGPVFLGSSDNPLPDIIADLRGQVDVVLQGQIDSVRAARAGRAGESRGARMRNTFRVVPDVRVSRFQLTMFGGRNRGVLVNSRDLCTSTERGVALFRGQNGALSLKRPAIRTAFRGCRKVRRMEIRRAMKRRAVLRKALRSGSYTPAQARRAIRG